MANLEGMVLHKAAYEDDDNMITHIYRLLCIKKFNYLSMTRYISLG